MGYKDVAESLYNYISSSSHVSDERRNTTSRRRHDRPRLGAVLDASITTAPFARRGTKLIDYRQIRRQLDRQADWCTDIGASS